MADSAEHICFLPGSAMTTFPADPDQERPAKRARVLSRKGRADAARTRKRGGCLRCRLLKIKCSGTDPCDPCLKLARTSLHVLETKTLRFSECIRTRIKDINIFESRGAATYELDPMRLLPATEFRMHDLFALASSYLELSRQQINQSPGLEHPNVSFLILEGLVSVEFFLDLRILVLFAASDNTRSIENQSMVQHPDDYEVFAGRRILGYLDQLLANGNGKGTCTATVAAVKSIVILITIFGLSLMPDLASSPDFQIFDPKSGGDRSSTLWNAMKEHIVLMLTHHFLYLRARLGWHVTADFERELLDYSAQLWRKPNFLRSFFDVDEFFTTPLKRTEVSSSPSDA